MEAKIKMLHLFMEITANLAEGDLSVSGNAIQETGKVVYKMFEQFSYPQHTAVKVLMDKHETLLSEILYQEKHGFDDGPEPQMLRSVCEAVKVLAVESVLEF